jgi:hypothetical protein
MKSLVFAAATAVVVSVLAEPVASFAQQSGSTVTRAQVKAELIQLEQAGYNPAQRDPYYPNNLLAAQARVAARNAAAPRQTGYGPAAGGSSQSGVPSQ